MLNGKKIIVVLPVFNAELMLRPTYQEMPHEIVDEVILVVDNSGDETVRPALESSSEAFGQNRRKGYGAHQKMWDLSALARQIWAIMPHPDCQCTPKLITALSAVIANGLYDRAL
jgi:hypothetical protein